jgi:hypothetical protein
MLALTVLVPMLLLFVLFFVRQGQKLEPQDALSNYLNAVISGRPEAAYHYLSLKDKAKQTLAEYRVRHSLGNGLLANMIANHISFVIEKLERRDDPLILTAAITAPDFRGMASDVFQGMTPESIPEPPLEAFVFICRQMSHYLDKYHRDAIPKQIRRETFQMIREKEGWRVCLDACKNDLSVRKDI